jgi:hypothetical protein
MSNGEDPTIRRRADREGLNQRDEQCWTLRQQRWSVRAIGRELNMPASSVQRCLERAAKRSRPGNVLAAVDDELSGKSFGGIRGVRSVAVVPNIETDSMDWPFEHLRQIAVSPVRPPRARRDYSFDQGTMVGIESEPIALLHRGDFLVGQSRF